MMDRIGFKYSFDRQFSLGFLPSAITWTLILAMFLVIFTTPTLVSAGSFDDVRCKCICPAASAFTNDSNSSNRKLYIGNVPPNQCNCDFVVLPQLDNRTQSKAKEFCLRCECKYESRNTAMIRFFVIFIIGVISFLVVYMIFLSILDPWIHQRSIRYQHFTEEVSMREQNVNDSDTARITAVPSDQQSFARRRMPSLSSNHEDEMEEIEDGNNAPRGVLNRVGHSQSKWKRQVTQQRKNIYDDHTMLN